MAINLLGITIGGLVAFILLLVGIIAVFGKKSLGNQVRGVLGMIPIGNPKLWGAILLILGFLAGGFTYGYGLVTSLAGGTSMTASIIGEEQTVQPPVSLDCKFATIGSASSAAVLGNMSFTLDSSDDNHYTIYAQNATGVGSAAINGTITCNRGGDIEQAARVSCYIKGDSFKNYVSTTDSNTYYILATSASSSVVDGVPWQQTAYLNDGAIATTSSDREKTDIVFTGGSSAQAKETVGFYFVLPGDTVFNYLRSDQDPQDVNIVCGDETLRVTIVKQTDV